MTASSPDGLVPQVVFACVRNGGRSVISRVLTEHYAGGRVRALSAEPNPASTSTPKSPTSSKDSGWTPLESSPNCSPARPSPPATSPSPSAAAKSAPTSPA